MKYVLIILLLASCATQYPLMYDYVDRDGGVYDTRIVTTLEERPILNYYRYGAVTQTPGDMYYFEVVTGYPIPEGVKFYICFDSVEVNTAPRRGDIKQVRYLYKQKHKKK